MMLVVAIIILVSVVACLGLFSTYVIVNTGVQS